MILLLCNTPLFVLFRAEGEVCLGTIRALLFFFLGWLDNELFDVVLLHEYQPILPLLQLYDLPIHINLGLQLIWSTDRLKSLLLGQLETIVPVFSRKLQNIIRLLLGKVIRNQAASTAVMRAHLVGQRLWSDVHVLQYVN